MREFRVGDLVEYRDSVFTKDEGIGVIVGLHKPGLTFDIELKRLDTEGKVDTHCSMFEASELRYLGRPIEGEP